MKYTVFSHDGKRIGEAKGFKECKELHLNYYIQQGEGDYADKYAGVDCSGDRLTNGSAYPLFYVDVD